MRHDSLVFGLFAAAFLVQAGCGKPETKLAIPPVPADPIFGDYTTVSFKETVTGCEEPTDDVANAGATFKLEPLLSGISGDGTVWYEGEAGSGTFALDTKTAEGVWEGVSAKSISGFGSTCLLFYAEEKAKIEGDTVTLEKRSYSGDVTIAGDSCIAEGVLDAAFAANRGKLACGSRQILIGKKAAP